jgi:hypothetical protein
LPWCALFPSFLFNINNVHARVGNCHRHGHDVQWPFYGYNYRELMQ